jgi:hypothetical protein
MQQASRPPYGHPASPQNETPKLADRDRTDAEIRVFRSNSTPGDNAASGERRALPRFLGLGCSFC